MASTRVAVIVGCSGRDYEGVQGTADQRRSIGPTSNTGNALSIISNRVSYLFDLRGPSEPLTLDDSDVEVYLKHRGAGPGGITGTVHTHPTHPFDVVGWDGCLYPYVFNVDDF